MLHAHRSIDRRHGLVELYMTQTLYATGVGLIGIFIPIYLYELGFGLQSIFLWLLVQQLTALVITPLSAALTSRIGFMRTTLVRIPFMVGGFLALFGLDSNSVPYLLPAFLLGISMALYWIPLSDLFSQFSDYQRRGTEAGTLESLVGFATVLAPAVGGAIAAALGFPVLILIALAVVAISTIPLFVGGEIAPTHGFRLKNLLAMRHHAFVGISVAEGFSFVVTAYLFPLFIFLALRSESSVGLIDSLGALVFAVMAYFLGTALDKDDRLKWLRIGAFTFAFTIGIRPFLHSTWSFALVVAVGGLLGALYRVSYVSMLYDEAARLKDKSDEFILANEMFTTLGKAALLGLLLMVPFEAGFFVAALGLGAIFFIGHDLLPR